MDYVTPCDRCVMQQGTRLENYLEEVLGSAGLNLGEGYIDESSFVRKAEMAPGLEVEYERQPVSQAGCLGERYRGPAAHVEGKGQTDEDWGDPFRAHNHYIETVRLIGHDEDGEEIRYGSAEFQTGCGPAAGSCLQDVQPWLGEVLQELLVTANMLRPIYIMDAPFRMAKQVARSPLTKKSLRVRVCWGLLPETHTPYARRDYAQEGSTRQAVRQDPT
jgi:hypothetical protein